MIGQTRGEKKTDRHSILCKEFVFFLGESYCPGMAQPWSLDRILHGHVEAQGDIMIESFSDANWGGNRDSRSTFSAQHFVNGQFVHSPSRNQHYKIKILFFDFMCH